MELLETKKKFYFIKQEHIKTMKFLCDHTQKGYIVCLDTHEKPEMWYLPDITRYDFTESYDEAKKELIEVLKRVIKIYERKDEEQN